MSDVVAFEDDDRRQAEKDSYHKSKVLTGSYLLQIGQ